MCPKVTFLQYLYFYWSEGSKFKAPVDIFVTLFYSGINITLFAGVIRPTI